VYDQYNIIAVNITKTGLYFVRFEKYAEPIVPRPRDANIKPPPQQKAAPIAVKIDNILSVFSFIRQTSWGYTIYKYYQLLEEIAS